MTYDPMTETLKAVEKMGQTALINLKVATDEAERILAEMKTRVDLGQMGAESIPALETAIAEAKQVQTEMTQQVADVQAQQAAISQTTEEETRESDGTSSQ